MKDVLIWLLALAVGIGLGVALFYAVLVGVAWLFLRPFATALEVLSMSLC